VDDSSGLTPVANVMPTAQQHHILIVDDEINVAVTLREGLAKLPNCRVAMATSGEQALVQLAQQPVDLLITDYQMPGMDGLALVAAVRQMQPALPILMITGYGEMVLSQTVAEQSIEVVLDKPVKLATVRQKTLEYLEKNGSER